MTKILSIAMLIALAAIAAPSAYAQSDVVVAEPAPLDIVILRGLDKITGRISTFDVRIGETVKFGTLRISARICHKKPPEEPPETATFLEIFDVSVGETADKTFSGWMFASSPALSAAEHPVYDVWVIDCRTSVPDGAVEVGLPSE